MFKAYRIAKADRIPGSKKIWQSYLKLNEYQFSSILNVDIFLNVNL